MNVFLGTAFVLKIVNAIIVKIEKNSRLSERFVWRKSKGESPKHLNIKISMTVRIVCFLEIKRPAIARRLNA